MTDLFVTKDEDLMKEMIFGGTKEKAVEICKELCNKEYDSYDSWSGFGLYLHKARVTNPEKSTKLAEKLEKLLDGQSEETHHVWIVLQEVMKFLAGTASEDFKKKVKEN